MKKSVRITCLVAIICIVLGVLVVFVTSLKMGFDYNQLNTVTLETKTYTVEEAFQNIDIQSQWSNVYFAVAEDGQCRVVCTETERQTCAVSVENDVLIVKQKDTRRWYEHFGIFLDATDETEMKITVYLPNQSYRALQIESHSGIASVGDAFSFDIVDINTVSGNIQFLGSAKEKLLLYSSSGYIEVEKVDVKVLKIESISGNIALCAVRVQENMTLESSSGVLKLEDVQAQTFTAETMSGNMLFHTVWVQNNMSLKSSSGVLKLEDVQAQTFTAETTSGDILFKDSDAHTLEIDSNSGRIKGNFLTAKKFEVNTTSGRVEVPHSDADAGLCLITTSSGDVILQVSES